MVQQRYRGAASPGIIMGRWDRSTTACSGTHAGWIKRVVVEQEAPQSVTIHWNDGSIESGTCSAGKGHCCVDPATPDGTACSVSGSSVNGSNCTPITQRNGYRVEHRDEDHNGIAFWTEFVPSRGIALHSYRTVDGTALSHGCVRLNTSMAKKVYCGSRQDVTWVQVRGFARPSCGHTALRREWEGDFRWGGRDLDGDRDQQASIRETRRMLNEAFGRNLSVADIRQLNANHIPKCGTTGARPSSEEARLTEPVSPSGTVPARILAASGFDARLVPFTSALSRVRSLRSARSIVQQHGQELWGAAVARAQGTTADTDDRAVYWGRLQMARALRQWEPQFRLNASDRAALLDDFERASRGMLTAAFGGGAATKKILISGFDPFRLGRDIRKGNPSAAAVLALDGRTIRNGGHTAEIQGVIFPVRFEAFDARMVEDFFGSRISKNNPVDMIMTISMGITGLFEVEEYAGRRRSSTLADNLGQSGGGSLTKPVEPPDLKAGKAGKPPPEFIQSTLPAQEIRSFLGRPSPRTGETEITEIPAAGKLPVRRTSGGPTKGSTAVRGSGGGFLSNEIAYRTGLLKVNTPGATVPIGHLHTPELIPPRGTAITSTQFETSRNEIVRKVEAILKAALPALP